MVALAAQRTGAGYVQVAVPAAAEQALELRLLEAMTRGCPDNDDGMHTEEGAETVEQNSAAAASHDIADKEDAHPHAARQSMTSRSVSTRSRRTSRGVIGTFAISCAAKASPQTVMALRARRAAIVRS